MSVDKRELNPTVWRIQHPNWEIGGPLEVVSLRAHETLLAAAQAEIERLRCEVERGNKALIAQYESELAELCEWRDKARAQLRDCAETLTVCAKGVANGETLGPRDIKWMREAGEAAQALLAKAREGGE